MFNIIRLRQPTSVRFLRLNRDIVNLCIRVLNDIHQDIIIVEYSCAKIAVACLMVAMEIHRSAGFGSNCSTKSAREDWCEDVGFSLQEMKDVSEVVLTAILNVNPTQNT